MGTRQSQDVAGDDGGLISIASSCCGKKGSLAKSCNVNGQKVSWEENDGNNLRLPSKSTIQDSWPVALGVVAIVVEREKNKEG